MLFEAAIKLSPELAAGTALVFGLYQGISSGEFNFESWKTALIATGAIIGLINYRSR